ncbi:MAG: hypothetical protein KF832_10085 [Caldilineaceae bacterium]|nr:hypothetical protein [Caldilineaceae bacterium]
MMMWIFWGYLAVSLVASLLFYATCVAAARADKAHQRLETTLLSTPPETTGNPLEGKTNLALNG